MQTPNSLGIGDGKAPGFFGAKKGRRRNHWYFVSALFSAAKRQHKNTDINPCQAILRASQNQAAALSIQESPAATLLLSSGNAGSCCKGWYPCFWCCHTFLRICRIRSDFPGPRKVGREYQEPVYRDSWLPICQSCIPAGIFAIYMTDEGIESFHGAFWFPSPYIYIA